MSNNINQIPPIPESSPPVQQPVASSGKAMAALICGIFAILFSVSIVPSLILGVVAIVLASKAAKESGKNSKTTGGKVCGIIGIVFSLIVVILYLVIGLSAFMYTASDTELISESSIDISSNNMSTTVEDKRKAEEAVQAELEKLKSKDAATVQMLAGKLDAGLKNSSGYRLTELGVDPVSFAQWMLADFVYQLDEVSLYENGTGSAYAKVTMRDPYVFATTFMEETKAWIDSSQATTTDDEAMRVKLGELYRMAMAKSTAMTDSYVSINLVKKDEAWTVDQDAWLHELDYLFDLY